MTCPRCIKGTLIRLWGEMVCCNCGHHPRLPLHSPFKSGKPTLAMQVLDIYEKVMV